MRFDNAEIPIDESELSNVESTLGLNIPNSLRQWYLRSNGGSPDSYVFENDNLDTVVSAFLPIRSARGRRTAVDTYQHLVKTKRVVQSYYFPFAVDGGGDYFFVDCSSESGLVSFYRSDPPHGEEPLLPLGITVDEFWEALKSE